MRIVEYKDITESSVGRVMHHYQNHRPMAFISASRSENSAKENADNTRKLQVDTNVNQFGYNKVRGGFIETDADGNTFEVPDEYTLIIFGNPTEDGEKRLYDFAVKEGKKFNQEAVLFIDRNGIGKYINTKDTVPGKPYLYYTDDDEINYGDDEVDKYAFKSLHTGGSGYFTKIKGKKIHFEDLNVSEDVEPYFPGIASGYYTDAWYRKHTTVEKFIPDND